jgi:tetratricopeptide (TPR) repeat protein
MKAMSIVLLLLAAFISYQPYSYGSNAIDKPNSQQVEINNMALKRYVDFGGPNIMKIKYLLSSHDFQSIEAWYESMFQQYKMDAQYEAYILQGYETFGQKNAISVTDLDLWVTTTGSYISYAARGIFKAQQGLYYETKNMQRLHDEAAKDLQIAISKNPSLMPAYTWLVIIAKQSKRPFTAKQILQKAEENDRRTFIVRYQYILSLQPRWGGSYQEMSKFAEQVMKYADSNPRLWSLQGEADADRADKYYDQGNYVSAIESYTAALRFGDRIKWLKRRAECYENLGQKDKSSADYERVRFYDPHDSSVVVRSAPADMSGFNYELKEDSYVDPKLGKYNIQSYVVLPVEHHVSWLNERAHEGHGVVKRNIDKIELMMMRLGKDCVERSKLDAILNEQKLSLTGLTNEKAQYVGKLTNADAVIITTIPSMGVHQTQSIFYEDIDIKAVSVATGKILWKSMLKGGVTAEKFKYDYEIILDNIETKLYELLESKLKKEMIHSSV